MNKCLMRVLCMSLVLLMGAAMFTACGDDTPVVVEPVDRDKVIVITTNPATADIMTFTLIIALNSADLEWSDIEGYRHTDGPDNTATFQVICTDDKNAELQVEYNPETDELLKADLTYGSVTTSILTDDNAGLMEILAEIEKG